jgi:hypothetical protein
MDIPLLFILQLIYNWVVYQLFCAVTKYLRKAALGRKYSFGSWFQSIMAESTW